MREAPGSAARIVYRCPECNKAWTVDDDPNEWAYGHDCEDEPERQPMDMSGATRGVER